MPIEYVKVAQEGELPPGTLMEAKVGRDSLCLANIGGTIFAVSNHCPHNHWSLAEGSLEGDEIVCPGHGMLFNVPNCTLNAFRVAPGDVKQYEVRVESGAILVGVQP